MPEPIDLQRERYRRLTIDPSDTWEGALARVAAWIEGERPQPYRPVAPLWASARTSHVFFAAPMPPEQATPSLLLQRLMASALSEGGGHRPARLRVKDGALADFLRSELAGTDTVIEAVAQLPAIDEFLEAMNERLGGPITSGSLIAACGGDVPRVRAFAGAAEGFFRARPWLHLDSDDPLHIESPKPPDRGLSWLTVMGAAGQERGLAFYESRANYDRLFATEAREYFNEVWGWALTYDPIVHMGFADADLWEDEGLPVAGPDAYPLVICAERRLKRFTRPDAPALAFLEGLLRALADTTEDELDSGRWTKTVSTIDGPQTYTLALPDVLKPPRETFPLDDHSGRRATERALRNLHRLIADQQFESPDQLNQFVQSKIVGGVVPEAAPRNVQEQAQDLVDQAAGARGRLQLKLARQALRLDPDCADAYVVLAQSMPDPQLATDLYRKAVDAGQRALGAAFFEENAGHFWGLLETRPYMRARFGLADALQRAGGLDEAITHYRELLRLNPSDNQGVRTELMRSLLRAGRDADVEELAARYDDDSQASFGYARALAAFRRHGDGPASQALLEQALRGNRLAAQFLLGRRRLPDELPDSFVLGGQDEAVLCADELLPVWRETPGALAWLEGRLRERRHEKRASKKQRPGGRAARGGAGGGGSAG
jgi:tetratricopeptide (TPR) repeat protein